MITELFKTKEITGKCVCVYVRACAQAEGQRTSQMIAKLIVGLPFLHMHVTRFAYQAEEFLQCTDIREGTAVSQWLRCCATNRKVAGSIPDGVIGIFH